jgi:hypothetical protein
VAHFNPQACISSCCPCSVFFLGCVLFWKCITYPVAVKVVQIIDDEETKEWIVTQGNSLLLGAEPNGATYRVYFQYQFGQQFIFTAELIREDLSGCPTLAGPNQVPAGKAKRVTLNGVSPINIFPPEFGSSEEYWGCFSELNGDYVVPVNRNESGDPVPSRCGYWQEQSVYSALFDEINSSEVFPILKSLCVPSGEFSQTLYDIVSACLLFSYNSFASSCTYNFAFRAINTGSGVFGSQPIASLLLSASQLNLFTFPGESGSNTIFLNQGIDVPCVDDTIEYTDVAFFNVVDNFFGQRFVQRASTFGTLKIETIDLP